MILRAVPLATFVFSLISPFSGVRGVETHIDASTPGSGDGAPCDTAFKTIQGAINAASDWDAAHGDKSLEVKFVMTEAELGMSWPARFFSGLARNLGISAKGGEGGKLAGLGRSKDALPFDWTAVDALVFDAYNPSMAPLQLSLKVKSGLSDGDPTAKFYHTEVMLPARKWAPVRLSQRRWVTISIPPESSTPD